MIPSFQVFQPIGSVMTPYTTSSPSGITSAIMQHAYGIDITGFGTLVGDGTGQIIAIVDAYDLPTAVTDLAAFSTQFGLPQANFTKINQTGGTTYPAPDVKGGWGVEIALDIEWAHAIAPKAKILLVEANSASDSDLYTAVDTARNWPGVSVVSMSWGADETNTDHYNDFYFTTPASHSGVSFVASSGDNGAYTDTGGTSKYVGYPAVCPNVIGIGGTTLTTGSGGRYSSESGWGFGTSSGTDGGSGGGISRYFAQPTYQIGVVTQSTTKRTVPDVAMDADPNSGVPIYDVYDNSASKPWDVLGGTALAAPMWAGVLVIANQGRVNAGLNVLTGSEALTRLYTLPASDFHDITTGNNGYAATAGYDLVTGRGSPIVNLLANDLVAASVSTPIIGLFNLDPTTVIVGTAVTLTASSVTETGGTISTVKFYRESNATSGLQIGGDTFLGNGTPNGSTWTLTTTTTSLAAGIYIYYAVATDTTKSSSNPASTTLTVLAHAGPPTIGSFTVSPTSVNVGASTTLTVGNVGEIGGSITALNFYRESNGSTGLQIGGDTLVGAGTQNGTTWTLSTATTGLAAGLYTYYAVATDATSISSGPSAAILTVTTPITNVSGLAWEVNGQSSYGTSGLGAGTINSNITNSRGLTRSSAIGTTTGAPASNAWGGYNWSTTTSASGITNNQFVTFELTVGAGKTVSMNSIDLYYRRNGVGPDSGYWQFQINNGTWTPIGAGDFPNQFISNSNSGAAITTLNLSTTSSLQNLAGGTVVKIRIVPYHSLGSSGTWYVYDHTGNDLVVNMTVNPIPTSITLNTSPATLSNGQSTTFTIRSVLDQFGSPISPIPTVTWSLLNTPVGTITQDGLYTAPASGPGTDTVQAKIGAATISTPITTVLSVVTGTGAGTDTIRLVRQEPGGAMVDIFINNITSAPTYSATLASISSLLLTDSAGDATFILDFTNGSPLPAGPITLTGTSSGTNTLQVIGLAASDSFGLTSTSLTHGTDPTVNFSNISTLSLGTGSYGVANDLYGLNLTTSSGATVTMSALNHLGVVTLNTGSKVQLPVNGSLGLSVDSLTITGGRLDLANNSLVVHNGDQGTLTGYLKSGYNLGTWTGPSGILSSYAALPAHVSQGFGMLNGAVYKALHPSQKVLGRIPSDNDVVVQYAYLGDATLDGSVSADDFTQLDASFLRQRTNPSWFQGDYNYDGVANASDFTVIRAAYASQATHPLAAGTIVDTPTLPAGASVINVTAPMVPASVAGAPLTPTVSSAAKITKAPTHASLPFVAARAVGDTTLTGNHELQTDTASPSKASRRAAIMLVKSWQRLTRVLAY